MRGTNGTKSAIERAREAWRGEAGVEHGLKLARRAWGDTAVHGRRLIRAQGLPVSGWLDDQAGRRRGDRLVIPIARFSLELAEAKVPTPEIARLVSEGAYEIAMATLSQHDPKRAA